MNRRFCFWLLPALLLAAPAAAQNRAAEAYQQAYDLVLDEQWADAARALDAFAKAHARSSFADDAAFWLCYAREQNTDDAEAAFGCYRRFAEQHPKSSYVNDARSNLVRLGRRLARSGKPEYEALVRSMQANSDDEVRLAALEALWRVGDAEALDAVIDLYAAGQSVTFKKKLVYVLGQFEDRRALEQLRTIALNDADASVRKEALFWLAEEGGPEALPMLEEIARARRDDVEVQKQLIFAFAQMADEGGIGRLIEVAKTHPNRELRKEAIFWLSEEGGKPALDFFDDLIRSTADREIQKQIIFAYGQMGEDGIARLRTIARSHPSTEIRKEAIFWIASESDQDVLPLLDELLQSTNDPDLQKQILFAFAERGKESLTRLMDVARKHPNSEVRRDAVFWLAEVADDDRRVLDFFAETLRSSGDLDMQKQILFALAEMGNEAIPRLIDVAKNHPNPQLRKEAVFWLGESDDERARKAILEIARGQ